MTAVPVLSRHRAAPCRHPIPPCLPGHRTSVHTTTATKGRGCQKAATDLHAGGIDNDEWLAVVVRHERFGGATEHWELIGSLDRCGVDSSLKRRRREMAVVMLPCGHHF